MSGGGLLVVVGADGDDPAGLRLRAALTQWAGQALLGEGGSALQVDPGRLAQNDLMPGGQVTVPAVVSMAKSSRLYPPTTAVFNGAGLRNNSCPAPVKAPHVASEE